MRSALGYEWQRLVSVRATWWLLALGVVGSALGAVAYCGVVWMLSEEGTAVSDVERLMVTVTKPSLAPVVGGILALLSVAGDRRHHLLGTALLTEPRRARMLAAKGLTTTVTALALALVTVVANAVVSRLLLGAGPGRPTGLGDFALGAVGVALACAGWCAVGLALGVLVQSQVAALAVLLVIPFGVERSLTAMSVVTDTPWLTWVSQHLPFRSADVLQAPLSIPNPVVLSHQSDVVTALVVVGAFSLGALALATQRFHSADIHPE